MSRRYVLVALSFLVLSAATSFAKSQVPKVNTRAAIKAYVSSAAKTVAKKGPSCDTFAGQNWMAGDYYIFVLGPDDKLICHPNAAMVGKAASEIVDTNGKKVGEGIVAAGKKRGGSWVEYVWPRPGTTNPVPKSTYATHVKGPDGKTYIVGSGGYEVK